MGAIDGLYPTPEMANTIQRWLIENTPLGIPTLFVKEGLQGYFDGAIFPAPINLAATCNRSLAQQTITFPQSVEQLPDFDNYDPSKKLAYVDSNALPLFAFGCGLSYTTFFYSQLAVRTRTGDAPDVLVSVKVTNRGSVRGTEVAQLYVRENVTSIETPIRSLAGFEHVPRDPGATDTVTFRPKGKQFEAWNEDDRWVFEPGKFTVWVGGSVFGGVEHGVRAVQLKALN